MFHKNQVVTELLLHLTSATQAPITFGEVIGVEESSSTEQKEAPLGEEQKTKR